MAVDLQALQRIWPALDRLVPVPAKDAESIQAMPLSGAFNVSSMQEMTPATIAAYFTLLRSADASTMWFYCADASAKKLLDGTVVRFDEYPWDDRDEVLLDELCPWAQVNYQMWPPRYLPRTARIRHRLVRLHKLRRG